MQQHGAPSFQVELPITAADIDELGHVNNVVYVRWVQEAAEAHWNKLSSEETRKQYYWVVMRHEIDYHYPVLLHDKMVARTWVGKSLGARSERFVQIYNAESGKIMAEAKTTWCLLSATTRKPCRIDAQMQAVLEG